MAFGEPNWIKNGVIPVFGIWIIAILSQAAQESGSPLAIEGGLTLDVQPFESSVVEKAPIVLRIRLTNVGDRTVFVQFKQGGSMRSVDLFRLHATDRLGGEHQLVPLATLSANQARAAGVPFPPGAVLKTDHAMCLKIAGGNKLLPPGQYRVTAVLNCPPEVRSNAFDLTVSEARGDDARALEVFESLPLYVQGTATMPSVGSRFAYGGTPDEVRNLLGKVRTDCTGSVFANWLGFWDAYHGIQSENPDERGPAIEAAIAFIEKHKHFPLADELLFRASSGLLNLSRFDRARDLLKVLKTDYPNTAIQEEELAGLDRRILRAESRERSRADGP